MARSKKPTGEPIKPAPPLAEPDPTRPDDPYGDKAALAAKKRAAREARLAADRDAEIKAFAGELAGEEDDEAEDTVVSAMSIAEAFGAARKALLDVSTPRETSAAAKAVDEAAKRARGFAWEPGPLGLPPHCPVRPLGKSGSTMFMLSPIDELVELTASKISQQGELDNLFSPDGGYLWAFYAKASRNDELRIKYEDLRRDLITACGRMALRHGLFDPMKKVRGIGGWRGPEGVLVLHLGDSIMVGGQRCDLGEVDGYVYARGPTLSPPADRDAPFSDELALLFEEWKIEGEDRSTWPGRLLIKMFQTWRWRRPDLDPMLILGYIVQVFLGAALRWRSQIFPIGDKATGKSSLLAIVKGVCAERLFDLADPSGPGIYQSLGLASIGVWCDEFESEGEEAADARSAAVLRIARYASDGKTIVRGGQDGVPKGYHAQGVFGFTAINPPPLKPAEQSRIAMPMLQAFEDTAGKPPEMSEAVARELGQHLLRRIADRWHDWPTVLQAWREVLLSGLQDSRAADQFGGLLAAAHLVTRDGVPLDADTRLVRPLLAKASLAETAGDKPNWEKCVNWLMQAQPDAWRNLKTRSVGDYLAAVNDGTAPRGETETILSAAKERLAQAGLGLVCPKSGAMANRVCVAVPDNHAQVQGLFKGSVWSMRPGAAEGGWAKALQFAPAAWSEHSKQRIDGRTIACTLLELEQLVKGDDNG